MSAVQHQEAGHFAAMRQLVGAQLAWITWLGMAICLGFAQPASTASATAASPTPDPEAVTLGIFTAPKIRKPSPPPFPNGENNNGRDGWVILNMMVDTKGKPFEVTVTDSTGNEVLERAAAEWMAAQSFDPATLEGAAVESAYDYKVIYISDRPGSRLSFRNAYHEAADAIARGDRPAADDAQQSMLVKTLYENAFYNLSRFFYFQKWGTKEEQVMALRAAIAGEKRDRYLPRNAFRAAQMSMFKLQIDTGDYGGALATYDTLDAKTKLNAGLVESVTRIRTLATDDRAFTVIGEIGRRDSWYLLLLKRRFAVDVQNGELKEIKLRCDRKYVFLRYQADLQYTIGDGYGQCYLELIGKQGSTFKLTQS